MNTSTHTVGGITFELKYKNGVIEDIAGLVPVSLMIQDIVEDMPYGCSYMNRWGCAYLGVTPEEIISLGTEFYDLFFDKVELDSHIVHIHQYIQKGDDNKQYNFFQRVRSARSDSFAWFYTVCKLIYLESEGQSIKKLIVLSSPVDGIDTLISRVNKTLDQDLFIRHNFKIYASLTSREKDILSLLATGKSSKEIADQLFISPFTVSTHRKNLIRKINCHSFAELLRFALAFDLLQE